MTADRAPAQPGPAEGAPRPVALAIRDSEFREGRVFDAAAVRAMRESLKPMAWPWLRVADAARSAGMALLTADQVDSQHLDPREVALISYDWTPAAASLLDRGARPAILLSLEPPVIAWQLYFKLRQTSARFPHTFLFEGARTRVAGSSSFHPLSFPVHRPRALPKGGSWEERGYLAMINSNKALARGPARVLDRPREVSLKRELAGLLYPPIRRDLYLERARAIAYFERHAGFHLYGEGWERRHPAMPARLHAAARRAYRGRAADKLETLAGYRFALAFENARFAGYVSEKLFDCFFAGVVPVYLGAPDIGRHVPPQAFVDARAFRGLAELDRYLLGLSVREWRAYREAAEAFLASAASRRFSLDTFAGEIVAALLEVNRAAPAVR